MKIFDRVLTLSPLLRHICFMRFQSFCNLVKKFLQLKHTFKLTGMLKKHCSVERVKGDISSKNIQKIYI